MSGPEVERYWEPPTHPSGVDPKSETSIEKILSRIDDLEKKVDELENPYCDANI